MLYNKEFLLKLDKQENKTIYARIIALNFQESPIEQIEGRVTQGSINLDGASAVRRSCSLTIVAQDFNYNDYYWGLNTKFKLEIGVKNTIDSSYPNIIWFNQGIYLISSFNTSRNTTSFNISIQGKDKMCLLNGEAGGTLESSIDFGTIEEEDKFGNWTIRRLPIQDIIKNIVHIYGNEPYHNIIINDLDIYGLELLEYRLDTPVYLYRPLNDMVYKNILFENDTTYCNVYTVLSNNTIDIENPIKKQIQLKDLSAEDLELLVDSFTAQSNTHAIVFLTMHNGDYVLPQDPIPYYVTKIEYGQTAGYRYTDLVYAGDLIANVGESVTSVLDKIKTMLTEFEYFYNIDGQFVFQKKQSFKETMWSSDTESESRSLAQGIAQSSAYSYEFYGSTLITAFNNNPNLLNLKNDYSIWGEREGVSGAKIPIHLRYAIDKKPFRYTQIFVEDNNPQIIAYNSKYNTELKGQVNPKTFTVDGSNGDEAFDWREILYQMALDYYKYNILDDFELRVAAANPIDYSTGRTGYEEYYVDLQGFWRDLYYPGLDGELETISRKKEDLEKVVTDLTASVYGVKVDWSENLIGGSENDLTMLNNYLQTKKLSVTLPNEYYGEEFTNDSHRIYQYLIDRYTFEGLDSPDGKEITYDDVLSLIVGFLGEKYFRDKSQLETDKTELTTITEKYEYYSKQFNENYYQDGKHKYWNKNVYEHPDQLNFWFDFLDTAGELQQFNIQSIGPRSKAVNDTNIKSIYFRETPSVIFEDSDNKHETQLSSFKYIQLGDMDIDTLFTCSGRGKNAKNKLDELIYQHGYCIESATITTIPIYYLEPNTRIYLYDETTKLQGDYIISKITIPLQYNGTMSITATKAAENIL